ncbi:hypothetical protein RIF23_07630 [Lipingzhangella sp. LS1_29]|uniref:Uncharacterized protein n=1 Tax=Lipingzhangella rawalii TaxID=2055835 RepID=A0ABU2H4C9_9ACTN|nr:hypothetical protein [Lipingzhangella rawalii]MDS1270162.1 hypothetical protein [Lipingzhangella rawalii]
MSTLATSRSSIVTHVWRGAVAGIGGGLVFGAMMAMAMPEMLPMIGMLVGLESAVLGFGVHLVNSAIIGLVFGVLAGTIAGRVGPVLAAGLAYGLVWWVLGPLLIMPAWLGMPLFMINEGTMMSLVGHLIYGLVTAAVLYALSRRDA